MFVNIMEFAKFQKGTSITKKQTLLGDIPVIAGGEKPAYYHNKHNRERNSITISSSGNAGFVSFHKGLIFASDCFTVESISRKLAQKYLYYYLKSKQKHIYSLRTNAAQPHIYPSSFSNFKIFIPTLTKQKEIVETLDNYSSWIIELNRELKFEQSQRQVQYEFYLQELLSPKRNGMTSIRPLSGEGIDRGGGVVNIRLGDICIVKTGVAVNKRFISRNLGKYPVRNSGREPLGYIRYWNTEDDPIGIASRGSVGYISWNEGRYYRGNLNYSCTIRDKDKVFARFLYYLLKAMRPEIKKLCTFEGIPALNKGKLERLEVRIPMMSQQRKIVLILDELSSCSEELMSELEVERRTRIDQYEYYRNKLLTF